MTRIQLFPSHLITSMPLPRITVTNWMQAHSLGGDQTHLDDLLIHLRLTWKFGSYFVTGYDAKNGESAGLLGHGRCGRPETAFWSSWNALDGYIKNGYGFERDEQWKPITVGQYRRV